MKTRAMTTWMSLAAIAGLLAGTILAVPDSVEAVQRGMRGPRWQGAPGPPGAHFGRFFRQLDLTEQQREAIHEQLMGERESHRDLRQRLFEARKLLHEAALRGEDASVLNQLAQAVGNLETQAALVQAQQFASIVALLEPEQQSKLQELYAEAEARRDEREERFQERLRERQAQ